MGGGGPVESVLHFVKWEPLTSRQRIREWSLQGAWGLATGSPSPSLCSWISANSLVHFYTAVNSRTTSRRYRKQLHLNGSDVFPEVLTVLSSFTEEILGSGMSA